MMKWWFANADGDAKYFDGETYPKFLMAHPRDHIAYAVKAPGAEGGGSAGAFTRMSEFFMAKDGYVADGATDQAQLLADTLDTTYFDDQVWGLRARAWGAGGGGMRVR